MSGCVPWRRPATRQITSASWLKRRAICFAAISRRLGGTVVIPATRGGNLAEYLDSLRRVRDMKPARLLPGHGPIVTNPSQLIDQYLIHRAQRDEQIVSALQQAGSRRTTSLRACIRFSRKR